MDLAGRWELIHSGMKGRGGAREGVLRQCLGEDARPPGEQRTMLSQRGPFTFTPMYQVEQGHSLFYEKTNVHIHPHCSFGNMWKRSREILPLKCHLNASRKCRVHSIVRLGRSPPL